MTASSMTYQIGPIANAALRWLQRKIGGEIRDDKLHPIGPYLTAFRPLEPACDLQRRWHVVQVEPQQEAKVANSLRSELIDIFDPKVPKRIRVNKHRHRIVLRPMLVGYVFAGFDVAAEDWRWGKINDTRGVLRLLTIGERPVPVPDAIIKHLREKEVELSGANSPKGPPITLKVGSYVRILEPLSFAGLFGSVVSVNDKARKVGVELDLFGRMVPLLLEPEMVEAV